MTPNEPSPLAFADKLPLPKVEDSMTTEQKYWYNKGHEDGRALTTYNKPRVEALEAEIERLKKQTEPDMFWNHDDPEQSHSSVNDVVVSVYENGFIEVGDEIEIQQAIKMENIKVKITLISDDGDLEWEQGE